MHTDERRDNAVSAVSAPVIAALPAEIDLSNSAEVGAALRQNFKPGVSLVIADLTGTVFCDSSGIRQLLLAHDLAAESQAELRLVARASRSTPRAADHRGRPGAGPVSDAASSARGATRTEGRR